MSKPNIETRIFITDSGDLIITDLWDEIRKMLIDSKDAHFNEQD